MIESKEPEEEEEIDPNQLTIFDCGA